MVCTVSTGTDGKVIAITDEEFKRIVWDAIKNNKVKYHRGREK